MRPTLPLRTLRCAASTRRGPASGRHRPDLVDVAVAHNQDDPERDHGHADHEKRPGETDACQRKGNRCWSE
jgi:hypothetical protein